MKELLPGVSLMRALSGHDDALYSIAWAPGGARLVTSAYDLTIRKWDPFSGALEKTIPVESAHALTWSPDGREILGGGTDEKQLHVHHAETLERLRSFDGHARGTYAVAWSPDGELFASCSSDGLIRLRNAADGRLAHILNGPWMFPYCVAWGPDGMWVAAGADVEGHVWHKSSDQYVPLLGHAGPVSTLSWARDGSWLVSGSHDRTLRVWSLGRKKTRGHILEGHTGAVLSCALSPDGRLLASHGADQTIRLWRTDTWDTAGVIDVGRGTTEWNTALAFHPKAPVLAGPAPGPAGAVGLWELDLDTLLAAKKRESKRIDAVHYSNAKVVLVGDSGVGKSGLALVLTDQPFAPTESTHNRKVSVFESSKVQEGTRFQAREVLLWDLAGQSGYRVFHRQHLHEVSIGLVLFDSRSEVDPFAGVGYWARALDEASRGFPMVKLLVAARSDRFGSAVSRQRVEEILARYGFAGFFETSAKRGDGVRELAAAIRGAIAWDKLPVVTAPELFADLHRFLVRERDAGRILDSRDELLARYVSARRGGAAIDEAVFDTSLGRLEAVGLLRRLSFGSLVLLRPELLDDYSAWLALAARAEPDGLGFIEESRAREGRFKMDDGRPLEGRGEESLLLTATVEDIVAGGIALRQGTTRGGMLVFPSELRTELPDYPGGYVREVEVTFEGAVKAIYATLAVSLAHSPAFEKEEFYKNAARFRSREREVVGFAVDYPDPADDARGRLTVFFDKGVSRATKLTLLGFIGQHVRALAFGGKARFEQLYQCHLCGHALAREAVEFRKKRGEATAICAFCGSHLPLVDLLRESESMRDEVREQVARAGEERQRQARLSVQDEREKRSEFHVLLAHNSKDKPFVRQLARLLREEGVLPWFDEEQILAGSTIVPALDQVIDTIPAAAVIVGPHDFGPWEKYEYAALLSRAIAVREAGRKRFPLIPVVIPGGPLFTELPPLLRTHSGVDFATRGIEDRDALARLVRGILGTDLQRP